MFSSPSYQGSRYFEPSRLAGLEKMRFTARRRIEGAYSGRHVTKQRGGSGEFVDYREYSPGDDLRRLDWKAMGRTGRSYLKLFQDESDLQCTMLLDCSGSMLQGSRSSFDNRGSKLEWAQFFCTALAHLITLGRDGVGLAAAADKLVEYLPPASSLQQRALVHQLIEGVGGAGTTALGACLDELLLQAKRRGVLLMLSDFLIDDVETVVVGTRKFRARGWEVIALHVVHPDEEELPAGNAFRFVGHEGEDAVNCQIAEVRQAYQQRFSQHLSDTRNALVSGGCDYYRVSTRTDYIEQLRAFMVLRNAS